MRALLSIGLFALIVATTVASNTHRFPVNGLYEEGGPGGGGGGGAGNNEGPGGNGGNGGGTGGGEGGQGGWGGPVSNGTDAECVTIAAAHCPASDNAGTLLLVNPTDCGSFCMCSSGVGKFMPCSDGLHFSAALQVCTWPWDAKCKSTFLPPTLN